MSPPAAAAAAPVFPDEILEEIFVRLDAAADLARASAACTSFRRVISARRFRSLHPSPVLGFLEFDASGAFHPAEPPRDSAPAARALAQAADFTFSFIGTPHCWQVCDARDSRVLLYRRISVSCPFADLMVCDPLHRRYVQLPPIPDDLAAATGGWGIQDFDPFLDPITDKEKEEQDLPFRVICAVQCQHKLVTFHFSSVTGKWRGLTFNRTTPIDDSMVKYPRLFVRHYAHGCFYWTYLGGRCSVLDVREMKFSVLDTPHCSREMAIVEVGGSILGLFSLGKDILTFYSKTLRNNLANAEEWQQDKMIPFANMDCCNQGVCVDDTQEWQHDKTLPLPMVDCFWSILSAAEGYVLLRASPMHSTRNQSGSLHTPDSHYFTLDIKTLLFERLCLSRQHIRGAHLYASFPPPLSLPSI